jgi:hypothetical protein
MRKTILKTSLIFFLVVQFGATGYTKSDKGSIVTVNSCAATIGLQAPIVISGTTICSDYVASIAQMGFTSQAQAEAYFRRYTCNLVSFTVLYSQSQVNIVLHTERLKTAWTVQQWNTYLQNKKTTFLN